MAAGPFWEKYRFKSPLDGFCHPFSDYETQWGYYAAYIKAMRDAPLGAPYQDLKRLRGEKPFHILTTNVDGQLQRAFPAERVTAFQGDFGFFQCSQPCCDEIYDNRDAVEAMVASLDENLAVPSGLVPRCARRWRSGRGRGEMRGGWVALPEAASVDKTATFSTDGPFGAAPLDEIATFSTDFAGGSGAVAENPQVDGLLL